MMAGREPDSSVMIPAGLIFCTIIFVDLNRLGRERLSK